MKKYQRGSFTVEAALIMPIVLMVILIVFFFVLYMYNRGVIQNAAYRGAEQIFYHAGESNEDVKKECNRVVLKDLENSLVGVQNTEIEIEVSANEIEITVTGRLNVPEIISPKGTVFEELWNYEIYAREVRWNPAEIIIKGQKLENIIDELIPEGEMGVGSKIQEGFE